MHDNLSNSPSMKPLFSHRRRPLARYSKVLSKVDFFPIWCNMIAMRLLPISVLLFTANATFAQAPSAPSSPAAPGQSPSPEPAAKVQTFSADPVETDPSALEDFREPLAPYGAWVEHPTYGTIWIPSARAVGQDFAPYQTAGRWAQTPSGEWLWVSDYAWGHIPFHYGRWVWIDAEGWAWIPGRVYAPAWVVWRVGDGGYIGWAPMAPRYAWFDGVAVTLWIAPPLAYVFCPTSHIFHHHVHRHVVRERAVVEQAVTSTRVYQPAIPTMASPQTEAPREKSAAVPRGPSLREAGIKTKPPTATRPDARSLRFSRPRAKQEGAAPPRALAPQGANGGRPVVAPPRSPDRHQPRRPDNAADRPAAREHGPSPAADHALFRSPRRSPESPPLMQPRRQAPRALPAHPAPTKPVARPILKKKERSR